MKKIMLLVAVALVASSAAYSADLKSLIDNAGLRPFKPGLQMVDFRINNLSGNPVSLSSYKGHVVLLNFWATWCPPCRSEMGSLEALYQKYKDKGLVVLAVDEIERPSEVKSFSEKFGLTFPILLDSFGNVGQAYDVRGYPTTYLISRKGDITSYALGAHEWVTPEMYRLVEALLSPGREGEAHQSLTPR